VHTGLAAVNELNNSRRFEAVLTYVLSIGNYCNAGGNKGGQHGVLLKTLPKLTDTRGNDKKTTLMDFLYYTLKGLKGRKRTLIDFPQDMVSSKQAVETSVKALSAEVEILAKDLLKIDKAGKRLKKGLQKKEEITERDEAFFIHLERYVTMYEENLVLLHGECQKVQSVFKKVLLKFGERPNTDSEDIFSWVAKFVEGYEGARKKFLDDEEKKAKLRRANAAAAKRDEERTAEKNAKNTKNTNSSDGETSPRKNSNPFGKDAKKKSNPFGAGKTKTPGKTPKKKPTPGARKKSPVALPPPGAGVTITVKSRSRQSSTSSLASADEPPATTEDVVDESVLENNAFMKKQPSKKKLPISYNPFGDKPIEKQLAEARQANATPTREGFLTKLSAGKHGRPPKWDKRWFELEESGYVNYYKKQGGKNSGSVYLQGCSLAIDTEDPCVVLIKSETRVYTLRAETSELMALWAEDLRCYIGATVT